MSFNILSSYYYRSLLFDLALLRTVNVLNPNIQFSKTRIFFNIRELADQIKIQNTG